MKDMKKEVCELSIRVIDRQIPQEEMKHIVGEDRMWEKVVKGWFRVIIPFFILLIAILIHVFSNPIPVLIFLFLSCLIVCLFYWSYHLHKYIRIALLLSEKLRLEEVVKSKKK